MLRKLTLTMLLFLFAIPLAANTSYFPQAVDGGGFNTTFTIMNPTTTLATGTLSPTDGLSIRVHGRGNL